MRLVLCGSQDLKTLAQWALKFEEVPNYDYPRPVYRDHPFPPELLAQFWKVIPVKDEDSL
jgi:hypothetical protein